LWETYRYAGLLEGDVTKLESTSASIASTLSLPYTQLAYAYSGRGDYDKMQRALERAMQLSPNPALRAALAELRVRGTDPSLEQP
jgi:tetratricopeptide repeat protein